MTNKDIKEIQDYIKSKGFDKEDIFKDIIEYDTSLIDKQVEYYKNVKGKYFKGVHKDYIEYHYVYPDILKVKTWRNREDLVVKEDNYSFRVNDNSISYYKELEHIVSNTTPDRYSDCVEISKEEFEFDINELTNLVEISKNKFNELKYEMG